jgi:hypothetical protein
VLFDLALERRGVTARRVEEHVAARDERLDLREAELREQRAQAVHLDDAAADVDGAEEGDVSRHQAGPQRQIDGVSAVRGCETVRPLNAERAEHAEKSKEFVSAVFAGSAFNVFTGF